MKEDDRVEPGVGEHQYLTVSEVAELLRCHRQGVLRAIANGELAAIKIGRLYRVHRDAIAALAVEPVVREPQRDVESHPAAESRAQYMKRMCEPVDPILRAFREVQAADKHHLSPRSALEIRRRS